jgi:hypothetical protein
VLQKAPDPAYVHPSVAEENQHADNGVHGVGLVVRDNGMVRVQRLGLEVRNDEMVRAQHVGLEMRKVEVVLVGVESSRILEHMNCVEKRLVVADIGLQTAVGVVEIDEPS